MRVSCLGLSNDVVAYFGIMQQTNSKKTIYWPLLLMPVMALGAIYWKIQHDKFPYVGVWVASDAVESHLVEVTSDGQFFIGAIGPNTRRKIRCRYRMTGETAIVTNIAMKQSTDPNSKKQYVGEGGIQAFGLRRYRTYTLTWEEHITPKKNGSILEVKLPINTTYTDQITGETFSRKDYKAPIVLISRKVK
jgi:hypothetical protein